MASGLILSSQYDPDTDSWFMLIRFSDDDYVNFKSSGIASLRRREKQYERVRVSPEDSVYLRRGLEIKNIIEKESGG